MKHLLIILVFCWSSNLVTAQFNWVSGSSDLRTTSSSGTVGIGNYTPAATLDVFGNKGGASERNFRVTYPAGSGLLNTEFSALTHLTSELNLALWTALYAKQGAGGYAGVFNGRSIFLNGNVGIGTDNPDALLHITQSASTTTPWVVLEGGGAVFENIALRLFDTGTSAGNINVLDFAFTNAGTATSASRIKSISVGSNMSAGANMIIETASNNTGGYNLNQLYLKNDGKIGIGTSSPLFKLDVAGGARVGNTVSSPVYSDHLIVNSDADVAFEGGQIFANDNAPTAHGVKFSTAYSNSSDPNFRMGVVRLDNPNTFTRDYLMFANGNIGIGSGTSVPAEKLHIAGLGRMNIRVGYWASLGETHSGLATIVGSNVKASNSAIHRMEYITTDDDGGRAIKMQYNEGISFHTYLGNTQANGEFAGYERMRIDNNGNVGIGTTAPDAKLAVKGHIHTQEVRVDLTGAVAPDYVFEPDYDLATLAEIETYIKENKHLPEVPSAKEMEENGMNLKEMNLILLKKVEELTLHLIEMKRVDDKLHEQNEMLLQCLEKLEK